MNQFSFQKGFSQVRVKDVQNIKKEIMEADDQDKMRQEKVKEYIEKFANPYVAASKGYIDAVIEPQETRELLLHALDVSKNKDDHRPAKKHGIPPF